MEKRTTYRATLKRIFSEYAQHKPSHGEIETVILSDEAGDQYQLLYIGWNRDERIFAPVLHARFHNDKIWIEYDGTMQGLANDLLVAGIPNDDIVLAFYSPWKRQFTDFAVA